MSTTKLWCDHWPPTTRGYNTTNVSTILNRRCKAQAWANQPTGILIYKYLILDSAVHCLHEIFLLSPSWREHIERTIKRRALHGESYSGNAPTNKKVMRTSTVSLVTLYPSTATKST